MALSADQIALLRLLLAGDTYERVAAVLGIEADEVKARAHAAAAALTDEPSGEFPLEAVNSRLAELEGAADPYPPPAVPHPRPTVAMTPLSRRWAVWLAAVGAVVIVAVVALLVVSGGAEEDGGSNPTPDREDIVPVRMSPVAGSRASGTIAIVRAVGRDRRLTGRAPIPSAASSLLPSFETAELTVASRRQAAAALQRAGQSGTLPQPVGTAVLSGTLP
jgi:hypothetical protein